MADPKPLEDYDIYNDIDYLLTTYELARASGFTKFPRPGGLDEQDPYWVRDIRILLHLEAVKRHELQEEKKLLEEQKRRQIERDKTLNTMFSKGFTLEGLAGNADTD